VGTDASLRPWGHSTWSTASGAGRRRRPRSRLLLDRRAAAELGDAEHDELRRLHRRDPDVDHELAGVARLRRVVLRVALHEERLVGRRPEERPVSPEAQQERVDRPLDAAPEADIVRLEDDPLGALEDRLLEVVEEPPDVEVAPGRGARQRPRAPDPDAPAGERPDAVDPGRIELVVLGLR